MHWYRESDALSWKVKSAFFDVELHGGQLWGVADCQLLESLEGDELNRLTTYLAGQASDGWGEGFEQQEIPVGRGLLYVHLWDGQDWEMTTTEPGQEGVATGWGCPHDQKRKPTGRTGKSLRPVGELIQAGRQRTLSIRTVSTSTCAGTTSFTSNGKSRKPSPCTRIVKCTSGSCLPGRGQLHGPSRGNPRPCKDALASYKADPYYQYLLHHREELDDAGLKKTSILPVLNYAQALETAIREDDLVTMRRHERGRPLPGFLPFLRCESTGCAGKARS